MGGITVFIRLGFRRTGDGISFLHLIRLIFPILVGIISLVLLVSGASRFVLLVTIMEGSGDLLIVPFGIGHYTGLLFWVTENFCKR